jgi:SOUL heme-binding protein
MTFSNPLFRVMQAWLPTAITLSLFLIGAPLAMATEEPSYRVTTQSEPFEIREYPPLIVAQVEVPGDLSEASSAGFRLIANYIFGNNIAVRDGGLTTAEPVSEKIAMTVPVIAEGKGDQKTWLIQFVMPKQYTMDTLPKPNNSQVKLIAMGPQKLAVIRFTGFVGDDKVQEKTAELMAWIKSKNALPLGNPRLARYNPPWSIPWMRRNEILIPIQ